MSDTKKHLQAINNTKANAILQKMLDHAEELLKNETNEQDEVDTLLACYGAAHKFLECLEDTLHINYGLTIKLKERLDS